MAKRGQLPGTPKYEVGYRRPPVSGQFKPGVSGNPTGRPGGAKKLRDIVRKELLRTVTVTTNGKEERLTTIALAFRGARNEAAKGNVKALSEIMAQAKWAFPDDEDQEPQKPEGKDPYAVFDEMLNGIRNRLAASGAKPGPYLQPEPSKPAAEPAPKPLEKDDGNGA